jgi:hypothetical protein
MKEIVVFLKKPFGILSIFGIVLVLLALFNGRVSADQGILGDNSNFFWLILMVAGGVFILVGIISVAIMIAVSSKK